MKFDTRRRVPVRLHIDHLNNPNRDVWAIDVLGRRYLTAKSKDVVVGPIKWKLCGPRRIQPRAYLFGYARVIARGARVWLA